MPKEFAYGTLGVAHTQRILDVYQECRSYRRTSLHPDIFAADATIARVVNKAIEMNLLPEAIKGSIGPRVDRQQILDTLADHPHLPRRVIAHMCGVGESTVYRALRGE